jgi:dihydropteroate synthase
MFLGAGGSKGNVEETSKKLKCDKNKEKTTKGKGTVPVQVHAVQECHRAPKKENQTKKEKIRVLIECHW